MRLYKKLLIAIVPVFGTIGFFNYCEFTVKKEYIDNKLSHVTMLKKKKEIKKNKKGHNEKLKKKINFQQLYEKSNKQQIDYMVNIAKTLIYMELMDRKYNKSSLYSSIDEFYYGPNPFYKQVKSFDS